MRRSTVIYVLLFLVMAGAYYFLNHREKPADIAVTLEPVAEVSYLFNAEDGTPASIRVDSKAGETVEVARNAENVWTVIRPHKAAADPAAAEAAASQATTMRILDTVPGIDLDIVGLNDPEYTFTIKFKGGVERKAQVGVITPTDSGYYVLNTAGQVVVVSKDSVDALLELLKNPPYLETLTPSVTPVTETPLPPTGTPPASTPEAGTATIEPAAPTP